MMAWPIPALMTWLLAWGLFIALPLMGLPPVAALVIAQLGATACAWRAATPWRQAFIAGGFPLSVLALGHISWSAGWWLLPVAALLLVYPLRSWRDAPLFPTPTNALQGLAQQLTLPQGAKLMDAGCGLGAGLQALHQEFPGARLVGLEWSWPLALVCATRCRFAQVRRADIWATSWGEWDVVYLFQRPETMPRAAAKARAEMRPGSWLVSLEFAIPEHPPTHRIETVQGKPVWIYRIP